MVIHHDPYIFGDSIATAYLLLALFLFRIKSPAIFFSRIRDLGTRSFAAITLLHRFQLPIVPLSSGQHPRQMLAFRSVVLPRVVGLLPRLGDSRRKGVVRKGRASLLLNPWWLARICSMLGLPVFGRFPLSCLAGWPDLDRFGSISS